MVTARSFLLSRIPIMVFTSLLAIKVAGLLVDTFAPIMPLAALQVVAAYSYFKKHKQNS